MNWLLAQIHDASPVVVLSVSLLALQVSVLVATGGIFVSIMISANETLSLLRRTLMDVNRSCRALEALVADLEAERQTRIST